MTAAPSTASAAYESEEERSLLFSDSDEQEEEESSQAGEDNNDDSDNDDLQWEDFMARYWSRNTADSSSNEFQIAVNADRILMMEDTDMMPHPLEPELDNISQKSNDNGDDDDFVMDITTKNNNDSMALMKILGEVGLQSTLEMAKLLHHHNAADHHYSKSAVMKKEAEGATSNNRQIQMKKKKKQLQEEFAIEMSNIPISAISGAPSNKSKKKKKKIKAATAIIGSCASDGGMQHSNRQEIIMSSPGAASTSSTQQQQEESLEDSLLAMAKRLSPGNDDHDQVIRQHDKKLSSPSQQQQQHLGQPSTVTIHPPNHPLSSPPSINNIIPPPPPSDSPLPNPDLIHQMGPIQSRTSLRSLLMKKWHPSWWMHYDSHSLLIFRSKDHLDDWVQNPYHGRRERAYLVKLRVDFGDIVGATTANNASGGVPSHGGDSYNNNNKESGNILGHRILPIKQKSYHKNEPEMYQFKLERWTNMGVSVLAAFASEEEKHVQLLYDTIVGIMESCPFGGLHNIDHMLKD